MPKGNHILTNEENEILNELIYSFENNDDSTKTLIGINSSFAFFDDKIKNYANIVHSSIKEDFELENGNVSAATKDAILRFYAINYMRKIAEMEYQSNSFQYVNRLKNMTPEEFESALLFHAEKFKKSSSINEIFSNKKLYDTAKSLNDHLYYDDFENCLDEQYLIDEKSNEITDSVYSLDLTSKEGFQKLQIKIKQYISKSEESHLDLLKTYPALGRLTENLSTQVYNINKVLENTKPEEVPGKAKDFIRKFTAINQMLYFAEGEIAKGNTDFLKKINALDEIEFRRKIAFVEKKLENSELSDAFFNDGNTQDILRKISETLAPENNKDLCNKQNQKNDVMAGIDQVRYLKELEPQINAMMEKIEPATKENSVKGFLANHLFSELKELKQGFGSCIDKNGHMSDFAIEKIADITATLQLLPNAQNTVSSNKPLRTLQLEFFTKHRELVKNIKESDLVKTNFKTGNVVNNVTNYGATLNNVELFAQNLNNLPYSKSIISGESAPQKQSETDEIEKLVYKNNIKRMRLEEEDYLAINETKNGYYNAGTVSYAKTKKEMQDLGDSFSDYLQSPVFAGKNIVNNPAADDLNKLHAGLTDLSKLLKKYGSSISDFVYRNDFSNNDKFDAQSLNEISTKLDSLYETCQNLMIFDISDNPQFNEIYAAISNAMVKVDNITNGSLMVPYDDGDNTAQNGKNVHFINDNENPDLSFLKQEYKKSYEEDTLEIQWRKSEEPPFSHDPCPGDIVQGHVGDCYFVSTLAAVAAKNPQAIRDMFSYNKNDNTVTVRLYNIDNEPIYVTMENSIPIVRGKVKGEEYNGTNKLLSTGARWVTLLEKAFTKANLADQGRFLGATYGETKTIDDGGVNSYVMKCLFGPAVEGNTIDSVYDNYAFYTNARDKIPFPKDYDAKDLEMYAQLKKLYDSGTPLTCATYNTDKKEEDIIGLPSGHAYGIVGFDEKDGFKYVYVKNPHGGCIRSYDENHNPIRIDTPETEGGVSKLELNDFLKSFQTVTAVDFTRNPIDRHNDYIIEQEKLLYLETIKEMDFMMKDCNEKSEEFLKLKEESLKVISAFEDLEVTPNKLNETLKSYFYAANKYTKQRDENQRAIEEEQSLDAATSYYSANVINKLGEKFFKNELSGLDKAEPISIDNLKFEAKMLKKGDSQAKIESVKKIQDEENIKLTKELALRDQSKDVIIHNMNQVKQDLDTVRRTGNSDIFLETLAKYTYYENLNNKMGNLTQKQIDTELSSKFITNEVTHIKKQLESMAMTNPKKFKTLYYKKPDEIINGMKEIIAAAKSPKIKEFEANKLAADKKKNQATM